MFKKITLFFSILILGIVQAQHEVKFTPEPKIQKVAEAYMLDCIDFVKKQFKLELDGSDSSVLKLEPILDNLSNNVKAGNMPPERVETFAKMFGFYIGETYRKNHGDVIWGRVTINGQKYYGLGKTETNEAFIWPVSNVLKRIHLGSEANIATYYSAITEE